MKGYLRSLHYMTIQAEKMAAIEVIGSGAFSLYLLLIENSFGLKNFITNYYFYFMYFSFFVVVLRGMIFVSVNIPLVLSYGSRRSEAFAGTCWYFLLQIMECTAMVWILASTPYLNVNRNELCIGYFIYMITSAAIALITGNLVRITGKIGYTIAVLVCMLLGGIAGGIIGVGSEGESFNQVDTLVKFFPDWIQGSVLYMMAILIIIICAGSAYLILRRQEVKL